MSHSLEQRVLQRFLTGETIESQRSFQLAAVGESELQIGEGLDFILSEPELAIPRTGHLGDWEPIASGCAGALDFNTAVCRSRPSPHGRRGAYGRASIYGFTQTEGFDGSQKTGDWVYKPGSFINSGRRQDLPLLTWNGRAFERQARGRSYFCPFVRTEIAGESRSLTSLHLQKMRNQTDYAFELEASILIRNWSRIAPLLASLIEACEEKPNPRQAYQDLVSHAVTREGGMQRCDLRRVGRGYDLDGIYFETVTDLVAAAKIPFLALTDADCIHERMGDYQPRLPILSNLLVSVLTALLGSHLRGPAVGFQSWHIHWGARDMAGFPPLRRGYFRQKSTLKSLRGICEGLRKIEPSIKPMMFILLPAAIFMLNPQAGSVADHESLEVLYRRLRDSKTDAHVSQDRVDEEKRQIIREWVSDYWSHLSAYFQNRFVPGAGFSGDTSKGDAGGPDLSDGFRALSFRDASLIVGTLIDIQSGSAKDAL